MGKSTISMVIFNSYVSLPEGKSQIRWLYTPNSQIMPNIYLIWVNYNDLTVLPHYNH